ncbi:MAG TPA: M14 family zinc carboxypeptidase, partial [Thermoanaerobaculia bacterium]|nr:M14 family zinc carboxypeptidase [Thermoanaerobaculia bacterium]
GGLDGYDLWVLGLTNQATPGPQPRLFVNGAIHAREYTTAELVTRFAEQLVAGYGSDADATWLLDEHEIHLMLHTNPDGRKHAEAGAYWRKNTHEGYCSPTSGSRGADLNRNFEFQWGCCGGSSGSQCSETYRGPSPASEPEAQAVQSYVESIFPDQRTSPLPDPAPADATGIFMDVHSYSELVLWPWGFTWTPTGNGAALTTLGRKFAYFNGYYPEQAIGLYPTDGTTDDFAYGELGVAAYTFELGTSFFQSCATFESTILPDNLPALLYAAKAARTPYLTPSGPEALVVAATPPVAELGSPVDVSAALDDTRFSNQNGTEPVQAIVAGEAWIDLPPWAPGGTPIALLPDDGSFNSPVEGAGVTLDTTGLTPGRHLVYLRGQDASGSWGPVSATFLWLFDPATAPVVQGVVRDAASGLPLAATVTVGPLSVATDPGTGAYSLQVPEGTYDLVAEAPDHAAATVPGVVLVPQQVRIQDFWLAPYVAVLEDDVESGNIGWTAQSPWAITTTASHSPTHSWTDSPAGSYNNNVDTSLTSPLVDLTDSVGVELSFWHRYQTEATYDFCHVEVSADGGATWTELASYDGSQPSWQQVTLAVPGLDGVSAARVRFRLTSDFSVTADGCYVDDVLLRAAFAPPPGELPFVDGFESGDTTAWTSTVP